MSAAEATLQPTHKELWHIVQGPGRKRSWRRFGVGFVNKDGSINLIIDLFPSAHFQLRDPSPKEEAPEETNGKKRTYKLDRTRRAK